MNRKLSKADFRKKVIESKTLTLVQFVIQWSGACQIISPLYEELASSYKDQANFFTVDVEKESGLDSEYGIIDLPTILFFQKGKVVDHIRGLTPKQVLISKIEDALTNQLN